jgi:FkbM family methyltransferase
LGVVLPTTGTSGTAPPASLKPIHAPGGPEDAAAAERSLFFSRWAYYLSSIPTLLLGIRNWPTVLAVFAGLPVRRPFEIRVRGGGRYLARSRMDVWIVKETCIDRDYERDEVPVQDGWTVVDIGAGAGDFAISVALRSPMSRVYAFEPWRESFDLMNENLALNGVTNVHAFAEAVAAEKGDLLLTTPTGIEGQHRTSAGAAPDVERAAGVRVPAVSLVEAFDRSGIAVCDFLKIDCEGGEYDILFHAGEGALGRVRHIAMEYHDGVTTWSHRDLVAFLESNGFATRRRPSPAHANLGFLFAANRRFAA